MIFSNNNVPRGFYVYAYLRSNGLPYYIGKGKSSRAWRKHNGVKLPKNKSLITIVESNLTEIGAYALERRLIAWYGRKDFQTGILHNKTEGGEGPSTNDRLGSKNPMFGKTHTEESNNKRRLKLLGKVVDDITRQKISTSKKGFCNGSNNPMFGKVHSEKSKELQSKKALNRDKVICEHCRKQCSPNNYKRWHGNNCTSKS
jgi:hypothetical protein